MMRTTSFLIAGCLAGLLSTGPVAAQPSPAPQGPPAAPQKSPAAAQRSPAAAHGTPAPGAPAAGAEPHAIAIVLGMKIAEKEKDNITGLIFGPLLDRFAAESKIEVTDKEIDAFLVKMEEMDRQQVVEFEQMRRKLTEDLKSTSLSDKDRKAKEDRLQTLERLIKMKSEIKAQDQGKEASLVPMKRNIARQTIRTWKVNLALYQKYGGRVMFQQAGVEPVDAYRDFLKEEEKKGDFKILDRRYEAPFWKYFTDEKHTFFSDSEGKEAINTPWWLAKERPAGK
jgi:hypothetical protein